MRFILIFLATLIVATPGFSAQAPFPPWMDKIGDYKDASGEQPFKTPLASDLGTFDKKVLQFTYDTASGSYGAVGAHGLSAYLPAGAVITRSYLKIITQFSDSGSGTVALSCEDANNIKTASDITGSSANAFIEGESDGAAANFKRGISAKCEVTATVATLIQDTGKLQGWVEYVLEQ